jgi:hypothetical protein
MRKYATLLLLTLALSMEAFAVRPVVSPRYHHIHRFRRLRWNPAFRPSRESLLLQNAEIDRLNLPRIRDDKQLQELIASEDLVPIVPSESLRIQPSLDPGRRYCRPWTLEFVQDLAAAYYKEFHQQIQVNSAVRTVQVQKKLRRHNRNAGPIEGETASTHLTGITLDISKRGLTRKQHAWIEKYFLPLKEEGLIDPVEERREPVFHVVVYERYTEWRDSQQQRMANTETDATD